MLTFKEDASLPGKFRAFKNRAETGIFLNANSAAEAEEHALNILEEFPNLARRVDSLTDERDALKAELEETHRALDDVKKAKAEPKPSKNLFKRRRR